MLPLQLFIALCLVFVGFLQEEYVHSVPSMLTLDVYPAVASIGEFIIGHPHATIEPPKRISVLDNLLNELEYTATNSTYQGDNFPVDLSLTLPEHTPPAQIVPRKLSIRADMLLTYLSYLSQAMIILVIAGFMVFAMDGYIQHQYTSDPRAISLYELYDAFCGDDKAAFRWRIRNVPDTHSRLCASFDGCTRIPEPVSPNTSTAVSEIDKNTSIDSFALFDSDLSQRTLISPARTIPERRKYRPRPSRSPTPEIRSASTSPYFKRICILPSESRSKWVFSAKDQQDSNDPTDPIEASVLPSEVSGDSSMNTTSSYSQSVSDVHEAPPKKASAESINGQGLSSPRQSFVRI